MPNTTRCIDVKWKFCRQKPETYTHTHTHADKFRVPLCQHFNWMTHLTLSSTSSLFLCLTLTPTHTHTHIPDNSTTFTCTLYIGETERRRTSKQHFAEVLPIICRPLQSILPSTKTKVSTKRTHNLLTMRKTVFCIFCLHHVQWYTAHTHSRIMRLV